MTKTATKTTTPKKIFARGAKSSRPLKVTPMKRSGSIFKSAPQKRQVVARGAVIVEPTKAVSGERRATKKAQLTALLQRQGGAAVAEMTEALGWLPHSVRAAMTGLRRDGCHILRESGEDGLARYRIIGVA